MKTRYLDMAGVGRALASPVSRHAVVKWRERYPQGSEHPFPEPDVITGAWDVDPDTGELVDDQDERGVPGWNAERLPEIEAWRARLPGRTGRPRKSD
ncbi:hypothetical protein GCM10022243_64240 [Saccharothrix violaceirubra]|uniref:Uncharacterized protein n=1 Tax=Saccharothrix violaceirubra TaxID=413306 RepID=A0A7W7WZQ8_9PSEU|nr:hypothetical protein [Saccharothrix violaceirubra]MBB4969093.1 hypothetical protein [Saccharothrix violaceirubra]